jgi:hypothetical protein
MIVVKPVRGNHVIEVTDFGKSMYGGWYLNFYDPTYDKYDGIRRDTLRELCAWLGVSRTALTRDVRRLDN